MYKLKYLVIYSVDIFDRDTTLNMVRPDMVTKKPFQITENNSDIDIEGCVKHRKHVGVISPEKLETLLSDYCVESTVDTMGSLTIEYGLQPAVAFETFPYHGELQSLYVTPLCVEIDPDCQRDMESIPESQRDLILKNYSNSIEGVLKVLRDYMFNETIPKTIDVDLRQLELTY